MEDATPPLLLTIISQILLKKTFQSGRIDCGISDHLLIFATGKVKRVKFHKHNDVLLRSPKHYTVNLFHCKFRKSKLFKL